MKRISTLLLALVLSATAYSQNDYKELQKITAPIRGASDLFAWSVSISGDYAIVGAMQEDHNASETDSIAAAGSAYIFKNVGGEWGFHQKLVASDRAPFNKLGYSVAIHGNTAVVAAYQDDKDTSGGNVINAAGSAYIYENNAGVWSEVQKIVPSNRNRLDQFGISLDIFDNTIIVGTSQHNFDANNQNDINSAGAAFFFNKINNQWVETQKIVASDRTEEAMFGAPVRIYGNYAIVGARGDNFDANGANELTGAGAAYIFENIGNQWIEKQKITAAARHANGNFGKALDISEGFAIIGASQESFSETNNDSLLQAGAAYVFEENGNGQWLQSKKIVASDRDKTDHFGYSVSISNNHAVVSAKDEDNAVNGLDTLYGSGSVYILQNIQGSWFETQKLVASDRGQSDSFGNAVSISNGQIIVGAYNEEEDAMGDNNINGSGSAYMFELCSSTSEIIVSACKEYTVPSGNAIYTQSGIYMDTILNSSSCDSIITIDLTINSVDTSVSNTSPTLTANASGASYQWLNCNNGFAAISGETNQSFTATENGSYAVEIIENGCTDTSACHTVSGVGILENTFKYELTLFPNPTKGDISIDLGSKYNSIETIVRDDAGKEVLRKTHTNTSTLNFYIEGQKGVYLIEVKSKDGKQAVLKVLKM